MERELAVMQEEMNQQQQQFLLAFEEQKNKLENEFSERQRLQEEEFGVERELKRAELLMMERQMESDAQTRMSNLSAQREHELNMSLAELELNMTSDLRQKINTRIKEHEAERDALKRKLMEELSGLKARMQSLSEVELLQKKEIEAELARVEAEGRLQIQISVREEIEQQKQNVEQQKQTLNKELAELEARVETLSDQELKHKLFLESELTRFAKCLFSTVVTVRML